MEEKNSLIKIHTCPVCSKQSEWYTIYKINKEAPCSEKCRVKNEKSKILEN